MELHTEDLLEATTRVAAAYLQNNIVAESQIGSVINDIHHALAKVGIVASEEPAATAPAISMKQAVKHDSIGCMECGKRFKMIKRHLRVDHDLSPEAYREKWNLPITMPMVAPDYAEVRRGLAKKLGLGKIGNPTRGRKKAA